MVLGSCLWLRIHLFYQFENVCTDSLCLVGDHMVMSCIESDLAFDRAGVSNTG